VSCSVSFIVPALNEERHIGKCLQSIKRLELPADVVSIETIVVDNQSVDRTAEISRKEGAVVERVSPGSPARARNAGANAARGDWLAFLDADCELSENWLTMCATHLRESQVVGVAGVMGQPLADATWVELAWFDLAHSKRQLGPTRARWLPTFNLLVRREAFQRVGAFDEKLTTCEDSDLGYRLSEIGTLIADPLARVIHNGESSSLWELFRREAWRTRGNFQLACGRPLDVSNWLSLLFPPCVVALLAIAVIGCATTFLVGGTLWPWFASLLAISVGIVLLVLRRTMTANLISLGRQFVVFLTYLTGRAVGLLWAFKRLER
jgi:GT2 family glycosyltransferase